MKLLTDKMKKLYFTGLAFALATPPAFARGGGDALSGELNISTGSNVIKDLINESPIVNALVQSGIFFGIVISIFLMAKDMLGGQGDAGKAFWGKLGAMIAFAALYYYLFMA